MNIDEAKEIVECARITKGGDFGTTERAKGFIAGWNARGEKDAEIVFPGKPEGLKPKYSLYLAAQILKLSAKEEEE